MATSTLGNGTLVLAGTTSGTTTVTATAVAGTTTLTLPAATDTLVGKATTDTLTNKTLTSPTISGIATFAAGSAAAPAITTTGDTNTGIFFPAADTIAFAEGGAEVARFDSAGKFGIGTASPVTNLSIGNGGGGNDLGVSLSRGATTNFYEAYDGTKTFLAGVDSSNDAIKIGALSNHPVVFVTNNGEKVRIVTSGNLLVGQTSAGRQDIDGISLEPKVSGGGYAVFNHATGSSSGRQFLTFAYAGTEIGSITQSGTTAVAYNTSSDYRLKNTIAPMTGALARVAALKPCTYKWNADGADGEGFIAHELAEVCPHAVTGEKDAVDVDGNPKYQGIDTSFLVATLTAAIQEQQALITQLTARITALGSA